MDKGRLVASVVANGTVNPVKGNVYVSAAAGAPSPSSSSATLVPLLRLTPPLGIMYALG